MTRAILYVHGMGGSAQEAEHYRRICPGFEVIGVDYEGYVPESVRDTVRRYYDDARGKYDSVSVIANSIGAYFSMLALGGREVARAMFVSPVLDMERVILDMMEQAGVSEQELREKGEIGALSWKYLCFVRDNPITWDIPTEILYAGHDDITSRETVDEFVRTHDAKLTVMDDGEHWFHTEEQVAFLDEWIRRVLP